MHTDSSDREDCVHGSYEDAVNLSVGEYRFTYDGEDPARAGARTRAVATSAHPYYWELVRTYDNHSYNGTVDRITSRQLNRAADAVADLIASL